MKRRARTFARRSARTLSGIYLVLRVVGSVFNRLAGGLCVLANAFDGVAGRGGGREHESKSGESQFHIGLHRSRRRISPGRSQNVPSHAMFLKPSAIPDSPERRNALAMEAFG